MKSFLQVKCALCAHCTVPWPLKNGNQSAKYSKENVKNHWHWMNSIYAICFIALYAVVFVESSYTICHFVMCENAKQFQYLVKVRYIQVQLHYQNRFIYSIRVCVCLFCIFALFSFVFSFYKILFICGRCVVWLNFAEIKKGGNSRTHNTM